MKRILSLVIFLSMVLLSAKAYKVESFTSDITISPNNKVFVTEKMIFDFQKGHFTNITRNLSVKKNDGIIIQQAYMDTLIYPFGLGSGQLQVTSKNVKWLFDKTTKSSHSFRLDYEISGLIYQKDQYDIFQIYLLPPSYDYKIDKVEVVIHLGEYIHSLQGELIDNPKFLLSRNGDEIIIKSKKEILMNENVYLNLHFPKGFLIAEQPNHIKMIEKAKLYLKGYLILGLIFIILSIMASFRIFRKYSLSFKADKRDLTTLSTSPENLSAWEGGFLLCRNFSEFHYMHFTASIFFNLVKKGFLKVVQPQEQRKKYFELEKIGNQDDLDPYEKLINDAFFSIKNQAEKIELGKALNHGNLKLKNLLKMITDNLTKNGLMDEYHYKMKSRNKILAFTIMIIGLMSLLPFLVYVSIFTISSITLSILIFLSGLILLIGALSIQPLTIEGYRLTQLTYYYKKHLEKLLTKEYKPQVHETMIQNADWLFAMNLQTKWFEVVKRQEFELPAWFLPISEGNEDRQLSFIYFLTTILTYSDAPLATIGKHSHINENKETLPEEEK